MAEPAILVTGGTGTTGRRVAAHLRERGADVRIAARTPDRVTGGAVQFDWNDPATFGPATSGVDRLYLLRPNGIEGDPRDRIEQLLTVARREGARRAALLHSTVTGPAGMPEIPELVRDSMPEWAIVCPSWFMQNFTAPHHPHARALAERGEIATATGEGRLGFVDAEDIAAAATALLLADEPPNDRYVLTGPQTLSYREIAETIGDLTGRPIRYTALSRGELAARWRSIGLPEAQIAIAVDLAIAIARGEHDYTTTTVESLTNLPPRSFRHFVEHHREVWHREVWR